MFSTVDVNNDGMVEWGEFSGVMAGQWLGRDGKIELEHAAALFREDVREPQPHAPAVGWHPSRYLAGARPGAACLRVHPHLAPAARAHTHVASCVAGPAAVRE
jgi:hypothetical protein